jgi:tetratricopeptide (TPR) repeat protein
MKKKYRVKLRSGRVVGPFMASQIAELYSKGHIEGNEQCQVFPIGDWVALDQIEELARAIISTVAQTEEQLRSTSDGTHTVALISSGQKARKQKENIKAVEDLKSQDDSSFQEFKFGKNVEVKVDYQELEKKYEEKQREKTRQLAMPKSDAEERASIEKTVILSRPVLSDVEKTIITRPPPAIVKQIEDEPPEKKVDDASLKVSPLVQAVPVEEEVEEDISAEKTEFFNLNEALPVLNTESKRAEKEFKRKAKKSEEEDEEHVEEIIHEVAEEEVGTAKKRKMKPIVAIAFFAIFLVLMYPDSDEITEIRPNYPRIEFPVAHDFIDEVRAGDHFLRGRELLNQNTYMSKLEAAHQFRQSLRHQFRDNDSLGYLIFTYAQVLENARDQGTAANTLFRLMQIGRARQYTDVNIAKGSALFYSKKGKHQTALNIIENYVRVSEPTIELYGIYLDVAMNAGRLDQAGRIAQQLDRPGSKPLSVYLSLVRFYELTQRYDKAREVIMEASEIFSTSVPLLLQYASLSLNLNDIPHFRNVLSAIFLLEAEKSPVYYAKYLEYDGMLKASEGKVAEAASLFQQALDLRESDELRSKLSQLQVGGGEIVENLILESRVIERMNQAREEVRLRNWDRALTRAIEAADILPNYIPAQLLLVDIQSRRGYFEHALRNLERLKQVYPLNDQINYHLVRTYIRAYRIEDSEREIVVLSQTDFSKSAEYASLLGKFYHRTGNLNLAIRNYSEAIRRNPLDDLNYFELAKIYLRHRRYDESREMIAKAIELDPMNVFYHSIFAQIIYELETAPVAIGYLRGILETNPDNPKILGDIAIYYFRAGQIQEFDTYRKRLEGLRIQDESFYEFLIEASKLRGNEEDVIKYSIELIRVNPGDLTTRMTLGDYLLRLGRHEQAIAQYKEITDRLSNYPRANYSIAKAYIALRNYDQAIEYAQREIDGNPEIDSGYYVMGEALRLKQEFQEALRHLERAISINGRSVEALIALGWIYYRQNFLDKARELYLRAQREDPSVAEIHRQLGYIYRSSGQGRLAAESFRTYLQLVPNASDRQQIEALIRQAR